ncbi:hypothetical protein SAMN05216286_2734 [Kosakonia oryzae]|uniref:Uncharacterized protein n=1 Tax=Kosakonia oryzae TaxID=497725 RepID=A0AA94KQD2_9ENTR|nr:hypothetical protein SAMN05216286_2734 [Kosakonia oryzae]
MISAQNYWLVMTTALDLLLIQRFESYSEVLWFVFHYYIYNIKNS